MAPLKTLILTAVHPESQGISQGLRLQKIAAPVPFWRSNDIALAQVGIRASRLAALAQLIETTTVQGIILAGLAGALSPELQIGDVVIDSQVPLPQPLTARTGRIHMTTEIVPTPTAKKHLFTQTSCLAVDMESQIVCRFARQRHTSFLHVRAISDAADDLLNPQMLQLVDDEGRPRIGRAIAMICRRPASLPAMLRLQRATSRALANLSKSVEEIVASGWPVTRE